MKIGTLSYRLIKFGDRYTLEMKRKFGFFTHRESVDFTELEEAEKYLATLSQKPEVIREGMIDL